MPHSFVAPDFALGHGAPRTSRPEPPAASSPHRCKPPVPALFADAADGVGDFPYGYLDHLGAEIQETEHRMASVDTALKHDASLPPFALSSYGMEAATASANSRRLVVVHIETAPGTTHSLTVCTNDSCSALALEFTRRHGLDRSKVWRPLTNYLQRAVDEARQHPPTTDQRVAATVAPVQLGDDRVVGRRPTGRGLPVALPAATELPAPPDAPPVADKSQTIPTARARKSRSPTGPGYGARLHALAAARADRINQKREALEARRAADTPSFTPRINARTGAAPESTARRQKTVMSTAERELQSCTFRPTVNADAVRKNKGDVVERLRNARTATEQRLAEKRAYLETYDPRSGVPLFRPRVAVPHEAT